jgi:hypothetical protein
MQLLVISELRNTRALRKIFAAGGTGQPMTLLGPGSLETGGPVRQWGGSLAGKSPGGLVLGRISLTRITKNNNGLVY